MSTTNSNNKNARYLIERIRTATKGHKNLRGITLNLDHCGPNAIIYTISLYNDFKYFHVFVYITELHNTIIAVNLRDDYSKLENCWDIKNQENSISWIINTVTEHLDTPRKRITFDNNVNLRVEVNKDELKELDSLFSNNNTQPIAFEITKFNKKRLCFSFCSPTVDDPNWLIANTIKVTLTYENFNDIVKTTKLFLNNMEQFTFPKDYTDMHLCLNISNSCNPFGNEDDNDDEGEWFLLSHDSCFAMIKIYVIDEKFRFSYVLNPNHNKMIPFEMLDHYIFNLEFFFNETTTLPMTSEDQTQYFPAIFKDREVTPITKKDKIIFKTDYSELGEQIKVSFKPISNALHRVQIDYEYIHEVNARNVNLVINVDSFCFVKEDCNQILLYLLETLREFKMITIPKFTKKEARDIEFDSDSDSNSDSDAEKEK